MKPPKKQERKLFTENIINSENKSTKVELETVLTVVSLDFLLFNFSTMTLNSFLNYTE